MSEYDLENLEKIREVAPDIANAIVEVIKEDQKQRAEIATLRKEKAELLVALKREHFNGHEADPFKSCMTCLLIREMTGISK